MISNQQGFPAPASSNVAAPQHDAAWLTPGKTGAASAFAALLGQLYTPQPVLPPVPVVKEPVATSQLATKEGDATAEADAAAVQSQDSANEATANALDAAVAPPVVAAPVRPVVPAVPPAFTPRAPRSVTSAISNGLRSRMDAIENEAKFAPLKSAPSNGGGAKRTGLPIDDDTTATPDAQASSNQQGTSAAVLAGVMIQASVAAQAATDAADAADTPSPEASSNATAATAASAPANPANSPQGSGAASPMVRAMTLLLDALGVTPDKKEPVTSEPEAKHGTSADAKAQQASGDSSSDLTTLIGNAKATITIAPQVESVKGKPEAQVEPAPGEKSNLPGGIVSQAQDSNANSAGQGDSRDRHDSREGLHRLHGEAASVAAPSDQGASSWSSTLGGAVQQGGAATDSTELGRAGATAHVPRNQPTPQPASTSQVTMDLDPTVGMLGKIRVAVRGETVHATITTQDSDAAAMGVRAHELRLALEQRGFSDARVTVRSTGTEDAPAAVIASSVTDLKAGATSNNGASGKKDSETQQQPRGDRRDQAGGDRPDTRRQRNRQEQPQ